ncbi:hypothetical protein ACHAWF_018666 [Thalassiosira exigua]
MPISGARASRSWNSSVCDAAAASSDGRWQKISCGIYITATIPYLVEGVAFEGWWRGEQPEWVGHIGIMGAFMFLFNGLFDLWLSVRFSDGDTCCRSWEIQDGDPAPRWTDRWPPSMGRRLRTANWYFFGSILYVIAMIIYAAAEIVYYRCDCDVPELWVTAAVIFVVHSFDCIAGTLISNAEPGARKTFFIQCGCKRWQDLDWYLWGDVTFIAAAIFDVVSNYCLPNSGTLISAINWLVNALIYTAGAFAHDVVDKALVPVEEQTASEIWGENAIAPLAKNLQSNPAEQKMTTVAPAVRAEAAKIERQCKSAPSRIHSPAIKVDDKN